MQQDSSFTAAMVKIAEEYEQRLRDYVQMHLDTTLDTALQERLNLLISIGIEGIGSEAFRAIAALARRQDTLIRAVIGLQMHNGSRPLAGRDHVAIVSGLESMVDPRDHTSESSAR